MFFIIQYLSVPEICKMAGRMGSIDPYSEAEEDCESYCSRIEMYFLANEINDDKKVTAFYTLVGPKVFFILLMIYCLHENQRTLLFLKYWIH